MVNEKKGSKSGSLEEKKRHGQFRSGGKKSYTKLLLSVPPHPLHQPRITMLLRQALRNNYALRSQLPRSLEATSLRSSPSAGKCS